jgi:phosphoribosylamine---glycine ligase
MNVLIVGSGGREHALAWKIGQSPHCERLYIAPGNAGTAQNVAIQVQETSALVAFARDQRIDLVIVGPEAPLAAGLADALHAAGIRVFGPSRAAAQIEASKSFAKQFMTRHGIPTARYASFDDFYPAVGYLLGLDYPVVIKASGLAAGKGVVLPDCADEAEAALNQMLREHQFGPAGDEVLIEERLEGQEVSVLAFTDGVTIVPMPPAQDHKRLLDGDRGPNTGGMGAFAPAPVCPPALLDQVVSTILQPTVDGLRAEGRPFTGVLYAGLMLTSNGPCVLEFNCRFGDPETQALLPLLDSDLLEIAQACVDGRLDWVDVRWKQGAAASIVLASESYPGDYVKGLEIKGLDALPGARVMVFHAGTQMRDGRIVTAGGRVLDVTAWDETLPAALTHAYSAIQHIRFEGMQYRKDIGVNATKAIL